MRLFVRSYFALPHCVPNQVMQIIILFLAAILGFSPVGGARIRQRGACCLCDSGNAVPPSKADVILLHNNTAFGNTCRELDLTIRENTEFDQQECIAVKRAYETVCCTEGFEGIEMFDLQVLSTLQEDGNRQGADEPDTHWYSSYLRAARQLWQTSSPTTWKARTSTQSLRVPSDTKPRTRSRQYSTPEAATNSTGWRSSWGSSGTSFFNSSQRPAVKVGSETKIVPSTNSSTTRKSPRHSPSRKNQTSSNRNSKPHSSNRKSNNTGHSVNAEPKKWSSVSCTLEPVGVRFSTPGGNQGFGICRNGSEPIATAQGAAIWDPNENKMFVGDCRKINQLSECKVNFFPYWLEL